MGTPTSPSAPPKNADDNKIWHLGLLDVRLPTKSDLIGSSKMFT